MSSFVNHRLQVPGDALDLPDVPFLLGTATRATRATRWYPSGRLEIDFQDGSKRMIPVDACSEEWIMDPSNVSEMGAGMVTASVNAHSDPAPEAPPSPPKSTRKGGGAASARKTPIRRSSLRGRRSSGGEEQEQQLGITPPPPSQPSSARKGRGSAVKSVLAKLGQTPKQRQQQQQEEGPGEEDGQPQTQHTRRASAQQQRQRLHSETPSAVTAAATPAAVADVQGPAEAGVGAANTGGGATNELLLGSPPAPAPHTARKRRSSGGSDRGGGGGYAGPSLPSTPTLQSALKGSARALPRAPSQKRRVSWTGQALTAPVTTVPRISMQANLLNFLILVGVSVPALLIGRSVCMLPAPNEGIPPPLPDLTFPNSMAGLTSLAWWQQLGYWYPLLFVNLLAFFNVDVLFWIVAQIQGTTWLIDPYWTLIPALIQVFYQYHPRAQSDVWRGLVACCLLRLWSLRLTISYLRREDWQFGAREDWRYTDLAKKYGRVWPVLSFFATYLVQHIMLVGITLPLYAIYTSTEPWNMWDAVITLATAIGMATSYVADNQLNAFMKENQRRQSEGMPTVLILDSGLWHISRHPNYFGEQLFWWGFSMFAVRLGQPWMVLGTLFNSLCMIPVTQMTEGRMLARPERADLFREYQRTTSVWVPWFKRR